MSRSIFIRIHILVVFALLATSALLTPVSSLGLDVTPTGFLLESDDILAYEVVETSENGVPGLTIELEEEGNNFTTTLDAGEEIAFMIDYLPDWAVNTSEQAVIGGSTNGGSFSLLYPAPYIASGVVDDEGPAYLMPVITIGDNTYWSDFQSVVEGNGFTVTNTATHFSMTQTVTDAYINVTWTKADGVLSHYRYEYVEDVVDKVLEIVRADWDIIPSQAISLGFSTTSPLLDYTVTEAVYDGNDGYFNFSDINIEENADEGVLDAHGLIHVGDRLQADVFDHRTEEDMGYLFELNDNDGAHIIFNTSINLPDENPQYNNMFLYPQFVVTDTNIIEGYLKGAEFVSESYSTFINATHFGIDFDHENGTIDATWELSTGFLTSWRLNNTEENQILGLDLIAGEMLENFDISYDHVVPGDGNTYEFVQISIEGEEDQLPLDEDSNPGVGYIGEGDLVYVDPIMASTSLDDQPPTVFYNVNGTNGYQLNISMMFGYPGFDEVQPDGPPLLYFHYLDGSAAFFDWVDALYTATGGSFDQNATHITISFSNDVATFEEVFRLSDLAMVSYYYENTEQGVVLEIVHVSDENIVNNNIELPEDTPDGLELPLFDGFTGIALMAFFVAIPILRRR